MNNQTRSRVLLQSPIAANLLQYLPSKTGDVLHRAISRIEIHSDLPEVPPPNLKQELGIRDDFNVILIVVDALRADVLPPARNKRQKLVRRSDTPFLNKWLKSAYRFHFAYAGSNKTESSMPAMFQSLFPYETKNRSGTPLGTYISSLGRRPIAAVNSVFFEPRKKVISDLLNGFEQVEIYQENAMHLETDKMLDLVDSNREAPFFAWFHFYCTHWPGYAGKRLLDKSDGDWRARYRKSLTWLDSELGTLINGLKKKKVLDKTVVIITADHGEGLGDHGLETHGSYIFEEEVRVPLSIWIPARKGGDIKATAGNVDIVPTVAEIFSAPKNNKHRGESLLPLIFDPNSNWDRTYYLQNSVGSILGVVKDRQKLIYHPKEDIFFRYNLETDPKEKINLFSPDGELDKLLLDHLVLANPGLFFGELRQDTTRMLIVKKLATIELKQPSLLLKTLLKLAGLDTRNETLAALRNVFFDTESDEVRALAAAQIFNRSEKLASKLVTEYLKEIAGSERELIFVKELGAAGQRPFNYKFVRDRLWHWINNGEEIEVKPWLELVSEWNYLPYSDFAMPFVVFLKKLQGKALGKESVTGRLAELTLLCIPSLKPVRRSRNGDGLEETIQSYLMSEATLVIKAACDALAYVGTKRSSKLLREILSKYDRNLRVKQAAMKAVGYIERKRGVGLIIDCAKDLMLTLDAIKLLQQIGGQEAAEYLTDVSKNHYNKTIRNHATRALKRVNRLNKKK